MNWIYYIIIYCIVCALLLLFLRLYNRNNEHHSNKFGVKEWILLIFMAPLFIVTSPIWLTYILITHFREKRAYKKREIEKERKENELKAMRPGHFRYPAGGWAGTKKPPPRGAGAASFYVGFYFGLH